MCHSLVPCAAGLCAISGSRRVVVTKDIDERPPLAVEDAREVALPLASFVRVNYLKALTRAHAEFDWAALALVSMEDAGASPRS